MIANYMFSDIDLPCFSRKLIRVNDPRVAYVTIGTKTKLKTEAHIHRGIHMRVQEEGERRKGATLMRSIDLERRRNAVNRKTVRDEGLR